MFFVFLSFCGFFCISMFFFFKQKTAYEMRISDWSSDVCSSDLVAATHIFDAPPEGVAADWTMPQNWQAFTPAQHATWRTLFDQQSGALEGYACTDFLRGLDMLRSVAPGVPDFSALDRHRNPATGGERSGERGVGKEGVSK